MKRRMEGRGQREEDNKKGKEDEKEWGSGERRGMGKGVEGEVDGMGKEDITTYEVRRQVETETGEKEVEEAEK